MGVYIYILEIIVGMIFIAFTYAFYLFGMFYFKLNLIKKDLKNSLNAFISYIQNSNAKNIYSDYEGLKYDSPLKKLTDIGLEINHLTLKSSILKLFPQKYSRLKQINLSILSICFLHSQKNDQTLKDKCVQLSVILDKAI